MNEEPRNEAGGIEFPQDVREFLLAFPSIASSIYLAQREMHKVNECIESQIARQSWWHPALFKTSVTPSLFQTWCIPWRADFTPGCPWIHFEYNLNWERCRIETSLDVEHERVVPPPAVRQVVYGLMAKLPGLDLPWTAGGGWVFDDTLKQDRMLVYRTEPCVRETFSAQWLISKAVEGMNQLSELIPTIGQTVSELFPNRQQV